MKRPLILALWMVGSVSALAQAFEASIPEETQEPQNFQLIFRLNENALAGNTVDRVVGAFSKTRQVTSRREYFENQRIARELGHPVEVHYLIRSARLPNEEGIEGYVYPSRCAQPYGTVRLLSAYNANLNDQALFPESEENTMRWRGYTRNVQSLGYVEAL